MKTAYKSIIVSALVVLFGVTGCDTDELHEMNINPQAVNQIDLHFLFSAAQLGIASQGTSGDNRYIDWRTNIGMTSTAIQHLATTGGITSAGMYYRHNEETAAAPFDMTYQDQLKNIAEILRQTDEGGYAAGEILNTRNAARILRVWSFQRLTDFYGAIPYTEANQGLSGIFFPTYDNQSVIYPDLLSELEEAIAGINPSNFDPGFEAADMIYQGDLDQWKRFGYSIMLRMAMRVSNVAPDIANEYVTKAVQGGVFQSNDDNVWIPMSLGPSVWTNQNGISRAFYPGDGGNQDYLSRTLVDFLKGANLNDVSDDDPRLMILTDGIGIWTSSSWDPIKQDRLDQLGMPSGFFFDSQAAMLGVTDFLLDTTYSRISPYMLDKDDPYMIMNYAEVEFLLAEAAERGIGGVSGAQAHYEAGVKAAMQMYEPFFANDEGGPTGVVSDAQVNAYLASYPYGGGGVTGGESALEQIGYQMWASKFFNWWEAWCDWRRTGFPTLVEYTDDINNVTGGKIPVRLKYPTTETVANPNFNQESKNNYTSPVWWDGGPE
ncbi:MAG TPA: SusD/RagB family nutrient-binding outer membrane lipoprotein [Cyclobacteriaceae bacterium]